MGSAGQRDLFTRSSGSSAWLLPVIVAALAGCAIEFDEPAHRDRGKCPDSGACADMSVCPGCRDLGRCPEAGKCPGCPDAGPCADAASCPGCPDTGVCPDILKPDVLNIKTVTDDTFNDFKQGTLSESGAKIYVSAKGNVQLLDRLDLNNDGWLDLVVSNHYAGTHKLNSYIYKGSAAGFSTSNRVDLPTVGANGSSVADLNDDGYPDIVFSNVSNSGVTKVNSYIYWGSKSGFSKNNRDELPTVGAYNNTTVDLNKDGYLDLVFSNHRESSGAATKYGINSYIYWGSKNGFTPSNRTELPTLGAVGVTAADLNKDSHLDLVFSNHQTGSSYEINSYVYLGSAGGKYLVSKRDELPTRGAQGCAVADLNGDSHLDIIFSNLRHNKNTNYKQNSYVYWGSSTGYTASKREELPTLGAKAASVADLNGDQYLDIVFSNNHDNTTNDINSYIYWGTASGYSTSARMGLPMFGGQGNLLADLNHDGQLDVVFSHGPVDSTVDKNVYIYWGKPGGVFSPGDRDKLPTLGAAYVTQNDPGGIIDRKPTQTFTSRVLDAGSSSPEYYLLSWKAKVPKNTSLKVQLRSASTSSGLTTAPWLGPNSKADHYLASKTKTSAAVNAVHKGHRYIQYRAILAHDFGNTPVLDRVEISYVP